MRLSMAPWEYCCCWPCCWSLAFSNSEGRASARPVPLDRLKKKRTCGSTSLGSLRSRQPRPIKDLGDRNCGHAQANIKRNRRGCESAVKAREIQERARAFVVHHHIPEGQEPHDERFRVRRQDTKRGCRRSNQRDAANQSGNGDPAVRDRPEQRSGAEQETQQQRRAKLPPNVIFSQARNRAHACECSCPPVAGDHVRNDDGQRP